MTYHVTRLVSRARIKSETDKFEHSLFESVLRDFIFGTCQINYFLRDTFFSLSNFNILKGAISMLMRNFWFFAGTSVSFFKLI